MIEIPADIVAAAQSAHKACYPLGPFVSTQLAQWALESGWGRSVSGKNNYFGIKATQAQIAAGKATPRWTREERSDGTPYSICAYFADYDSLAEGFLAHAQLLCKPWYRVCQEAKTPEDYCRALQVDHYATAVNYANALIGLIETNGLKRYD